MAEVNQIHYYFAYGSNIDQAQMKKRCPENKFIGKAILKNYKLAFTTYSLNRKCGCADLIKTEGEEVWGVIYILTDDDLKRLDKSEGSNYRRLEIEVVNENNESQKVLAYVVINKRFDLKPSKEYLALITNGAKVSNFPESYAAKLSQESTQD